MTVQDAEKAVKDAWIVSLVAIGATVLLTMIYASGAGIGYVDWWNWLDLIILAGLAYGIWRKSGWSAIIMAFYFLGSRIVLWVNESAFIGAPIALIFAYFFWRGARGAFLLARESQSAPV